MKKRKIQLLTAEETVTALECCLSDDIEACEKDDGFDVVAYGKIDEYATFEEEYHIRTFEDFTAKLPMFIISVFQVYYYSTKCGMFCANAEICKYRPEV